jgi:hypothetical protein
MHDQVANPLKRDADAGSMLGLRGLLLYAFGFFLR